MSQREQLQFELEELNNRRQNLVDRKNQSYPGTQEYAQADNELVSVNERIRSKQAELEQLAATSETVSMTIYESLESLPLPGTDQTMPLSWVLATESFDIEQKIEIIASAFEKELLNALRVKVSYEGEIQNRDDLIAEIRNERDQANTEVADLRAKLRNATEQLEEERENSKRKDAEISSLREHISKSTVTSSGITYEESKEQIKKDLESRPAIYDLQWTDGLKRTHYTAKRVGTGEQMEPFSRLTLGLYRVLETEAEVQRFREEHAQREMEEMANQPIDFAPEAPELTFPSEETTAYGLDQHEAIQSDDAPVTRSEFEALKERVAHIERQEGVRGAA